MVKCFKLKNIGDPTSLNLKNEKLDNLKENEIRIKNHYISINHMDIHYRNGTYPLANYDKIIGISGGGEVIANTPNTANIKIGTKVVYATNFMGSYSEEININANNVIAIDEKISLEVASAVFLPALTSHYLISRCYIPKKTDYIIVNGATGNIAHILCQWLSSIKINVIGLVGNKIKADIAKNYGCKYVSTYDNPNLRSEIMQLTKNYGANAIYDTIGKNAYQQNIDLLGFYGMLINYGDCSGLINEMYPLKLMGKSLFVTKPFLSIYKYHKIDLVMSAKNIFDAIKNGNIKPKYEIIDFDNIPNAHRKIEARESIGTIIARL
jgi:NADPH2:quinone reductase